VNNSKPKQGKVRRFVRRAGVVLFGIAVVFSILLLIRQMVKHRLEDRIQSEIAAIRLRGEPVNGVEGDKLYPRLPDAENSALVYLRARSKLVRFDFDDEDTNNPLLWILNNPSPSDALPTATKDAMRLWLGSNSVALEITRQGGKIKDGSYPLDLTNFFTNVFSAEWSRPLIRRDASRLIAWSAIVEADDGNANDAFNDLMDLFGLARSLKDHPYAVAQMFRETCIGDSFFAFKRIINQTQLSDPQLREVFEALQDAEKVDWIKRSMIYERFAMLEIYPRLPKPSLRNFLSKRGSDRLYSWWYFLLGPQRNLLAYMDIMNRYVETTKLALPERLAAELKFDQQTSPNRYGFNEWIEPPPDWAHFTARDIECQTDLALAEVAIGIERYRLANHKIPDDINKLFPVFLTVLPKSPFNGQPFRYEKLTNGYAIHCIVADVSFKDVNRREVSFEVDR
jgi:hypothetical protein